MCQQCYCCVSTSRPQPTTEKRAGGVLNMDSFEQLRKFVQFTSAHKAYLGISPFSSSADLPAPMAQMRTPNTALATTSAIEYPTCSYVVATEPARPRFLTMYTKG